MQKIMKPFFVATIVFLSGTVCGQSFDCIDELLRSPKPTKATDPSLIFNANMLTSGAASSPNIIFANDMTSPVMNAWSMVPSGEAQRPINMQFSIPSDVKKDKPISIELHFLLRKQSMVQGKARIKVNALYVHDEKVFPAPNSRNYTNTNLSDDFAIVEPSAAGNFKHVFIDIPLEKSELDGSDFAIISLSRVAPANMEYMGDIYLVAVAFRYTEK